MQFYIVSSIFVCLSKERFSRIDFSKFDTNRIELKLVPDLGVAKSKEKFLKLMETLIFALMSEVKNQWANY